MKVYYGNIDRYIIKNFETGIDSYKAAGVDLKKISAARRSIASIISLTHNLQSNWKVISGFGHYAGLIKMGNKVLALHSDGVGTKVILAQLMDRFDTVGIDCVAMNVNDVICVGAQPIGFVDYIALGSANQYLVKEIIKGLVDGSRQCNMAIVGGETAIVPDIFRDCGKTNIKNSFDLVGMVLGIVDRSKLILGNKIITGDIILGVESSGLHSNGYTLARKVLLTKYSVDDKAKHIVHTVGEELLIPTRLYIRPVMEILKQRKISVHGLAHITGGSFSKLSRLNRNVRYNLDNLPVAEGIFKLIQNDGQIAAKEMYKTFNMGIGLCMVIPKASCDRIISVFEKYNMKCRRVGTVDKKGDGEVIAKINNKNEILSE